MSPRAFQGLIVAVGLLLTKINGDFDDFWDYLWVTSVFYGCCAAVVWEVTRGP